MRNEHVPRKSRCSRSWKLIQISQEALETLEKYFFHVHKMKKRLYWHERPSNQQLLQFGILVPA